MDSSSVIKRKRVLVLKHCHNKYASWRTRCSWFLAKAMNKHFKKFKRNLSRTLENINITVRWSYRHRKLIIAVNIASHVVVFILLYGKQLLHSDEAMEMGYMQQCKGRPQLNIPQNQLANMLKTRPANHLHAPSTIVVQNSCQSSYY